MIYYIFLINNEVKQMTQSLFERLGGKSGIINIANDLVDNHISNKTISNRFEKTDVSSLKHAASTFMIAGTGGPQIYQGKDMLSTHKGMNISAEEFMAVLDDALEALEKNNIAIQEQQEVLYILYSMRSEVVKV
jgi:hemoglobin